LLAFSKHWEAWNQFWLSKYILARCAHSPALDGFAKSVGSSPGLQLIIWFRLSHKACQRSEWVIGEQEGKISTDSHGFTLFWFIDNPQIVSCSCYGHVETFELGHINTLDKELRSKLPQSKELHGGCGHILGLYMELNPLLWKRLHGGLVSTEVLQRESLERNYIGWPKCAIN